MTLKYRFHPNLTSDCPEGMFLKADNADEVYLVQLGSRHHIPNPDVYFALFSAWDKIVVKSPEEVNTIPVGISPSFFRRLSD